MWVDVWVAGRGWERIPAWEVEVERQVLLWDDEVARPGDASSRAFVKRGGLEVLGVTIRVPPGRTSSLYGVMVNLRPKGSWAFGGTYGGKLTHVVVAPPRGGRDAPWMCVAMDEPLVEVVEVSESMVGHGVLPEIRFTPYHSLTGLRVMPPWGQRDPRRYVELALMVGRWP